MLDATVAEKFVLITTDIVVSFLDECGIRIRDESVGSVRTTPFWSEAPKKVTLRGGPDPEVWSGAVWAHCSPEVRVLC